MACDSRLKRLIDLFTGQAAAVANKPPQIPLPSMDAMFRSQKGLLDLLRPCQERNRVSRQRSAKPDLAVRVKERRLSRTREAARRELRTQLLSRGASQ